MKISAQVQNSQGHHHVTLSTNNTTHSIDIPSKSSGYGSGANGGDLLLLPPAIHHIKTVLTRESDSTIIA